MCFQNKCLLLLLFLTAPFGKGLGVLAEDTLTYFDKNIQVKKFDEKQWKGLVKDLDYSEKKQPEEEEEDVNPEREEAETSSGAFNFSIGTAGKVILYGIAILVLVFIIVKLIGGNVFISNPSSRKDLRHTIESLDEEIRETDLERFLREAISKQQYKLAVRIYYLMILKELTLRNWIDWRKEKTNREYILEMSVRRGFENFPTVTRVFESAWYGENDITSDQYQKIVPPFQEFINSVKRTQV